MRGVNTSETLLKVLPGVYTLSGGLASDRSQQAKGSCRGWRFSNRRGSAQADCCAREEVMRGVESKQASCFPTSCPYVMIKLHVACQPRRPLKRLCGMVM